MKFRLLAAVLLFARFAPAQTSACAVIEGDSVLASDLVTALPGFRQVAPDTVIALAPLPGVRRIFRGYEIAGFAKKYSIDLDATSRVCVERRLEQLNRERVIDAMRAALQLPDARIEIVDISLYGVPEGKLEFKRESLHAPPVSSVKTPVEWRGNVVYGNNHRFSIWARVIISAIVPRVIATEKLVRGAPIQESQVRVEMKESFPALGDLAETVEQVTGLIPWKTLPEGSEIRLSQTVAVADVQRGDIVDVEVRQGPIKVTLTAKAESAGRNGDTVTIRNTSSNRLFEARVSGKKKALVEPETIAQK